MAAPEAGTPPDADRPAATEAAPALAAASGADGGADSGDLGPFPPDLGDPPARLGEGLEKQLRDFQIQPGEAPRDP